MYYYWGRPDIRPVRIPLYRFIVPTDRIRNNVVIDSEDMSESIAGIEEENRKYENDSALPALKEEGTKEVRSTQPQINFILLLLLAVIVASLVLKEPA